MHMAGWAAAPTRRMGWPAGVEVEISVCACACVNCAFCTVEVSYVTLVFCPLRFNLLSISLPNLNGPISAAREQHLRRQLGDLDV